MNKQTAVLIILCVVIVPGITGCGAGTQKTPSATQKQSGAADTEEESKPSANDKPYIDAGTPFFAAIAARDYKKAWGLLSSHAKANMTLSQFKAPSNDKEEREFSAKTFATVSAEQFAELLAGVEKDFGTPKSIDDLHVHTTDIKVLTRKSTEELAAVDSMFAIGAMPDSIPGDIRRASLRGQIVTQMSAQQLEEVAKAHRISVEELTKDPDFKPYFNLKVVLVEEGGKLLVGYFEFLPPSMLD
jgi:hypothetical protein